MVFGHWHKTDKRKNKRGKVKHIWMSDASAGREKDGFVTYGLSGLGERQSWSRSSFRVSKPSRGSSGLLNDSGSRFVTTYRFKKKKPLAYGRSGGRLAYGRNRREL